MERLTHKDMEVLKFTGRQRCVRPEHIEDRFDVSRATAYRRLRWLTELDLLADFDRISPRGEVFAAMRKGLAVANLGLRPTTPTMEQLTHDEAMTEVVCDLEHQRVDCLTERELIARSRLERDGRHQFPLLKERNLSQVQHRPDIVCELGSHDKFIAIEVELSPKNVDRWRDILYAFSQRVHIDGFIGVLYVVGPSARGSRIAELAAETSLGDRFQLRRLGSPDLLDALLAIVETERPARGKLAA